MKIAIIGAGNLGLAIAEGLYSNDLTSSLALSKRNIRSLSHWESKSNVIITNDNPKAIEQAEFIFLTVQPSKVREILRELKPHILPNQIIVSAVTGFTIHDIEQELNKNQAIIRCMPNTAIAVQASMTCLCANQAGESYLDQTITIFDQLGVSMVIQEELMQAATVICASGIAFWMRLIRASTQGAIQLGFEAHEAQKLTTQTCFGAAKLLLSTGNHPEQEIDRVTTPMGCTISGLNEMEHQGLSSSLIKGMMASFEKIHGMKSTQ